MKKAILFLAMFGLYTCSSFAQTKKTAAAETRSKPINTQTHKQPHTPAQTHSSSQTHSESKPAHVSSTAMKNGTVFQDIHNSADINAKGTPVNPSDPKPKTGSSEQKEEKAKTPDKNKKEWQCTYIYKDGHRCTNMTNNVEGRCWKHEGKSSGQ